MTAELKAAILCAILFGLAAGALLTLIDQIPEPQIIVIGSPDIPPAEITALHEEARRITREADGGTR